MSKEQHDGLNDMQMGELLDHDEDPELFDHLIEDFQDMMGNKQVLRNCVEKFIENVVDEFTLGIIFDIHRKFKTNAYCLEIDEDEEEQNSKKTEACQQISTKSGQKFICPNPNCERAVGPSRFGRHLANCMGISDTGRSSRNASRRAATNKDKTDSSPYTDVASDDDDDEDWNSRKKNRKKEKNGGKKNRGTPKKNADQDSSEPVNVDIEGNYDEATNLYMMDPGNRSYMVDLEERSSSASPTDVAGLSTPPKKQNKSKKKSRGKDRGSSSSTSLSFD